MEYSSHTLYPCGYRMPQRVEERREREEVSGSTYIYGVSVLVLNKPGVSGTVGRFKEAKFADLTADLS